MKILIAAGGSGGHIFPAIALCEELKKNADAEIIFVASKRALDKKVLKDASFRKIFLSINPMPYRLSVGMIVFTFKFIFDLFASILILLFTRPGIIVGFGGYTGSIVLIGSFMGIKTLIHEQNLIPGRANKLLDKKVDCVATSFRESEKYFKNKNVVFTGNPLRRNITSGKEKKLFENEKFTVLVIGGSQGARSLNRLVLQAVEGLGPAAREKMHIIHIAGPMDYNAILNLYKDKKIEARVFSFIDNIHEAYRVTDLAISRSGAAAVFELALYGIPMILIPYPFKKNNQRFNAKYFAEKGAAVYREEKELSSDDLKDIIADMMSDRNKLKKLSESAKNLSVSDASEALAKEVIEIASSLGSTPLTTSRSSQ